MTYYKQLLRDRRHPWSRAAFLIVIIFAYAGSATAQAPPTVPTLEATAPSSQASPTPQAAPTPKVSPTPSLERRFFRNLLDDQRAIWTSPLRLRGEDAKWLAPLGAASVALIATDRRTAGELDDDDFRLNISRGVSEFGSIYTTGGVAATFYFIGRGTGNVQARETGLLGLEALANGVAIYGVLKRVTQRPTPRAEGGHGRFFNEGNSFPSAHAVNAWALATVVAYEYKDRPIVRYGAYGLATAVSLSRFGERRHFLSDVLVGSAIGFGIGRYVYRTHHEPSLDRQEGTRMPPVRSKLRPFIVPSYDRRTRSYGMSLRWSL